MMPLLQHLLPRALLMTLQFLLLLPPVASTLHLTLLHLLLSHSLAAPTFVCTCASAFGLAARSASAAFSASIVATSILIVALGRGSLCHLPSLSALALLPLLFSCSAVVAPPVFIYLSSIYSNLFSTCICFLCSFAASASVSVLTCWFSCCISCCVTHNIHLHPGSCRYHCLL